MSKRHVLIIIKSVIAAIWLSLIFFVAIVYLPYNPLTPSGKVTLATMAFFPEGWGFFTKNAQDADIFVYKITENRALSILRTPNSSLENWLGLKRNARSQGTEYGLLLDRLYRDSIVWTTCEGMTREECVLSKKEVISHSLKNSRKDPSMCGEVYILFQNPVPWAWSKRKVNMPIKLIKTNISCND